jgi:hypothetical protein
MAATLEGLIVRSLVLDLTPILNRRAMENDRALLKGVQIRAAHLSDCLLKQSQSKQRTLITGPRSAASRSE